MTGMIKKIEIQGFKSIRNASIELGNLNVLIGANGSGKSNFVSFFKMLRAMMKEEFAFYIARNGRASSHLFYGPQETDSIGFSIEAQTDVLVNVWGLKVADTSGDGFVFEDEYLTSQRKDSPDGPLEIRFGTGHQESVLAAPSDEAARKILREQIRSVRAFQFHDTSRTAKVLQSSYVGDSLQLHEDAGNLAAFLYRLKKNQEAYYQRIVTTIRHIAPFFGDFVLEPDGEYIMLRWHEIGSDVVFGGFILSDGLLRFMALAALLLQPTTQLPGVIIIDEPELGLHPYAIESLAGLLGSASLKTQVIIATQSVDLLDCMEASSVIAVNRSRVPDSHLYETKFERVDSERYAEWLDSYTLGELWQKNVIGGGPWS